MNTQSHKHRTLVVLATAVLYAILFYRFEMGLNLLVFDAILLLSMFKLAPDLAVRPGVQWASAGLLFSAVMVVIVHGPAATLAHHVSYVLLLGFVQAKELRFIWFGLLLGLITLFTGPLAYLASLKGSVQNRVRGSWAGRVAPYCFAAIIAVPFFVLYLSGNGRLGEIVGTWMTVLGSASIGEHFFKCLFLIGSALLLSVGIFFPRTKGSKLTERQLNFRDQLRPEDGNEFEIMAGSATGAEPTPPPPTCPDHLRATQYTTAGRQRYRPKLRMAPGRYPRRGDTLALRTRRDGQLDRFGLPGNRGRTLLLSRYAKLGREREGKSIG